MTFDWNSLAKFESGQYRSLVTPPLIGIASAPLKIQIPPIQPIQTKFSRMAFDWNSSAKFKNGHHRSHVTPPNWGFLPPLKIQIPPILMKFKPYVLATK